MISHYIKLSTAIDQVLRPGPPLNRPMVWQGRWHESNSFGPYSRSKCGRLLLVPALSNSGGSPRYEFWIFRL